MNPNIADSPRAVAWKSPDVLAYLRAMLKKNGDSTPVADEPFQFMRLPEVKRRTGLSMRTIYRRMSAGTFPKPVRIDAAAAPKKLPRSA